MSDDEIKDVDKNIAFIIELVGGLFGFLGIGYMYSGLIVKGVIRLLVWWVLLGIVWFAAAILSYILIGLCMMPFIIIAQVLIPIWSAFSIKNRLQKAFPGS